MLRTTLAALALAAAASNAAAVNVRVTVENLSPENSVTLAPFRFGFGQGLFDSFNNQETAPLLGQSDIADAPIVTIAEGGSGSNWFPAFEAAEPDADLGSVLGPAINPFLPGQSSSTVIDIDPTNRYFTFATMVVPSNDHFLGNDNPMAYEVFDTNGNLILDQITQNASAIWDAGSETQDPANAAFLAVGTNANRVDENEVVRFDFAGLSAFDGLETAAGYNFDHDLLSSDTPVLRVSFSVVPEPATLALGVLGVAVLAGRRRR